MTLVTSRYMKRFGCLGGACEDTCCQRWNIPVDRSHFELLHERLTAPEDRARLEASMKLLGGDDPHRHALLVFREDNGCCAFLADDKLCSLHARFGEAILPDICSHYPRRLGRIDDRIELMGEISCPEIARQVLLRDDALEVVGAEPELFGRRLFNCAVDSHAADPYERGFPAVRALAASLIEDPRFPIRSRLYFLAALADRNREALRPDGALLDARAFKPRGALPALHEEYETFEVEGPFAVAVARTLLRLPGELVPPALRRIADRLEALYAERGAPLGDDVEAVHAAYRALPPLAPEAAARLDQLVARFAAYHVRCEWYIKTDSFIGYVHELLTRIALVRFVAGSLPAEPLDALVVAVVYNLARMFQPSGDVGKRLVRSLEAQGMDLARAVALIRL
jgi:lysine-N-methylase